MLTLGKLQVGLDARSHPANVDKGSLVELRNAHITPGGEIVKAKAFLEEFSLPAGTVGMRNLGGQLTVFGDVDRPAELDAGIGYEKVAHPEGSSLVEVISAIRFGGGSYIVASYENGEVIHFYRGQAVSHWSSGGGQSIESLEGVAAHIAERVDGRDGFSAVATGAELDVIGENFTFEARALNATKSDIVATEIQTYVPAIGLASASASFSIAGEPGDYLVSLYIGGVEVLGGILEYSVNLSNTAIRIADRIKANSPYDARAVGYAVIIDAPAGSAENGNELVFDGTLQILNAYSMSGGSDAAAEQPRIVRFTLTGEYEEGATYQVVLDGQDSSKYPTAMSATQGAVAHQNRVFVASGEYLTFSALGMADFWNPDPSTEEIAAGKVGAGFLRITDYASQGRELTALAPWGKNLAAFSERAIALLNVDPDPSGVGVGEILTSSGSRYPRALFEIAGRDVLYVSDTGVRSLRSRATLDAPFSLDVGSLINDLVVEALGVIGQSERRSVIAEGDGDGRVWVLIGSKAFCLSFFPDAGIGAWSRVDVPGFVRDACNFGGTMWIRVGDSLYAYGGRTGDVYDASQAEVITWFEDNGDPDEKTGLSHLSSLVRGEWGVQILTDPERLNVRHDVGVIGAGGGFGGRVGLSVRSGCYALRAVSTYEGPAKISRLRVG